MSEYDILIDSAEGVDEYAPIVIVNGVIQLDDDGKASLTKRLTDLRSASLIGEWSLSPVESRLVITAEGVLAAVIEDWAVFDDEQNQNEKDIREVWETGISS